MIDAETLAGWKTVASRLGALGYLDERDERILALIAEVERLSRYAPTPEVEALLARSSLGADDAKAARESVSPDAGRLVVRLSQVMAQRDALQAQVDAVRASLGIYPLDGIADDRWHRGASCIARKVLVALGETGDES